METTPVSFKFGNNSVCSLESYNILSDIVNCFVISDQFLLCFFFILKIGLGNGSMTSFFPSLNNWMQSKSIIIWNICCPGFVKCLLLDTYRQISGGLSWASTKQPSPSASSVGLFFAGHGKSEAAAEIVRLYCIPQPPVTSWPEINHTVTSVCFEKLRDQKKQTRTKIWNQKYQILNLLFTQMTLGFYPFLL